MTTSKTAVLKAARRELARGHRVVPIPPGKKHPVLRGWPKLKIASEELPRYIKGDENLGLLTGEPSGGLVDVDLDSPEARQAASVFLPATGMIHGRRGNPRSHFGFESPGITRTKKYADVDGKMLVELRSTGAVTLIPPSTHPSGEELFWESNGDPAPIDGDTLRKAVARVASCALIAGHWPVQGSRHHAALALAGLLARHGWQLDDAKLLIVIAATIAGDEEAAKRASDVASTFAVVEQGRPATGGPTLEQLIGNEVVRKLSDWLGFRDTGKVMKPRKGSQADRLVELADEAELFRSPDGDANYATIEVNGHRETWSLRSKGFRRWLTRRYFESERKSPNAQALVEALGVLEAMAQFSGPEHEVFIRCGKDENGNLYLDLVNKDWEVVQITPTGFTVLKESPIKFRRSRGMLSLPYPDMTGGLDELREFLNLKDDDDWRLVQAWILHAFRPTEPCPVLGLHGEQGSAKSTNTRVLRELIDPNTTPLRSEPKDIRDFMIAANNAWCLPFDNLSHLSNRDSDALCRLSTGGGFSTRELYTDQEEVLFHAQRPIILNGIEELATRADLLDRSIVLYLPPIPPDRRKTERQFWQAFNDARPRILGALVRTVSAALGELGNVDLPTAPRMADFAAWGVACERALGWPDGSFLRAYALNREGAQDLVLEGSPLTEPVREFLAHKEDWTGTASDLLANLRVSEEIARSRYWPKSARALSNALRRLTSTLRDVGVTLDFHREGHTRRRLISIKKVGDLFAPFGPSDPEPSESDWGLPAPADRPLENAEEDFAGAEGAEGADAETSLEVSAEEAEVLGLELPSD